MKFSPIFSFALLMCCLMSVSVQAQQNSSPFTDQFQKLLEKKFDADGPGAAVLVAKNGEVIFRSSIGKANIELGVSIEPDHVFRIGSITKQFTAVAILMLMEEGKLALDDELTRFLPDYPTKGKSIDVAQLLTHTSGIPSYTSMPGFLDNYSRNHFTPEAIIDSFKNEEFDFEPNTEFRYNNSGYVLLGAIIEKISGMSYADFIQQRIFDKIGMTQSYYDDHSTIIPKRASGYEKAGDGYANASYLDMSLPYAAGSLLSTVDDLYKWQSALQADKLVKKETLQQAFTRYKLKNGEEIDYGYGWFLNKLFGEPVIEHSGGIYGFLAQGVYIPNDNIYVAVLTNCTCVSPNEVARMMAAIEMGKYSKRTPKPMSATDLKEYVGVYAFKSEEGKKVTIQVEEDHLMGQQSGGSPQSLFAYDKDKFFVESSMIVAEFQRDPAGSVLSIKFEMPNGDVELAERTDELPAVRQEIDLPPSVLERYVGAYELMPGFILNISLKDGQLHAQATGQGAAPIFAESETKFFLKVVDAQLEFIADAEGAFSKLILYQGGQELTGNRK